jgi:uncharacterized HAD superfamily protein
MQDRWENETDQKICAFDIDGVLNYYPAPWVDFLNKQLVENFTDLNDAKRQVPYQIYKDLKWEYRESGIKAHLKYRTGAREVTKKLKELGYMIIILTSRPFDEHKTLFKQTTDWLDAGHIQYDSIISSKQKYVEVLTKAPNIRFLVDDHRYYVNSVSKWGYNTVLVDNKYNQGPLEPKVTRIKNLKELLNLDFVIAE